MVAKWRVVVEGQEAVFDSPREAAEFAITAIEKGARELVVERELTWRERLYLTLKRGLCKPLRVRVLYYRIRYWRKAPPLTLPL